MKRTVLSIWLSVTIALGAGGCVIHGDGRGFAYGVDAVVVAGGVAMMNQEEEDSGCEDAHGYCFPAFDPAPAIGGLMVLGGAVAMLLTLLINAGDDDDEKKAKDEPPAKPVWIPRR
jgi:hypothetical protein